MPRNHPVTPHRDILPQGILSRLLHDPIAGVRGEAVKALALVATVADASAGRWLLLLGEVSIYILNI